MDRKYAILETCACATLRQNSRLVTQYYENAFREQRITSAQFHIMSVLANTGSIPLTQLAEILLQDRTGLTRNLTIMVKHGWIKMVRGTDRRIKNIELTEQGFEKLDAVIPLWQSVQKKVSEGYLNLDQIQHDRTMLKKLIEV